MASGFNQLLLTQVWQVTLLIVVVVCANRWLSSRRPHLAHLLWLVVLVKCVTPPLWCSAGGVFCWLQPGQTLAPTASEDVTSVVLLLDEPDRLTINNRDDSIEAMQPRSDFFGAPASAESASDEPLLAGRLEDSAFGFGNNLPGVWLAVTMLVLAALSWRWLRFWKLVRSAPRRECPELETQLDTLSKQLGLRRRVRLVVTESRIGPAVIGVFRATVLLPAVVVDRLQGNAINPILTHELLHVRRGDLWIGLLQTLAQTLWWFHPLVWWVSRLTTRDAERCCDEAVLAELNCDPADYARSLLDVLELKQELKPVPVFPGVRPVDVTSKRLERIMSLRQGCRRRTPWWCWLVALGAAALTLPGAAFVVNGQDANPVQSSPLERNLPADAESKPVQPPRPERVNSTESSPPEEQNLTAPAAHDAEAVVPVQQRDLICAHDLLQIQVDSISGQVISVAVRVNKDGVCTLPGIGTVKLAGLSVSDAKSAIDELLRKQTGQSPIPRLRIRIRRSPATPEPTASPDAAASSRRTRLSFGPVAVTAEMASGRDVATSSGNTSSGTAAYSRLALEGEADTLAGRADDLTFIRNSRMATLQLAGHVDLTTREGTLQIQAEEVAFILENNARPDGQRLIGCKLRNARIEFQSDAGKSALEAREIVLQIRADTFAVQNLEAQNVDSIRVSEPTPDTKIEVNGESLQLRTRADAATQQTSGLDATVSLRFKRARLGDVIGWLAKAGGFTIEIDHEGLAKEGVTSDQPISIAVDDTPIRTALTLVLEPLQLGSRVQNDGTLIVSSGVEFRGRLLPAVYSVADLVVGVPERVVIDGSGTRDSGPQGRLLDSRLPTGGERVALDFAELTELITESVEPDSWESTGGEGSIRTNETTLSLVVRQTKELHEEISDLLWHLRRLRGLNARLDLELLRAPADAGASPGLVFDFNATGATNRKQDTTPRGVFQVGGRAARCVSRRTTEQLRRATQVSPWLKVCLFNGQTCDLNLRDAADATHRLQMQPVISADGRFLRLYMTMRDGSGTAKSSAESKESSLIGDGESVLLDVTGLVNPPGRDDGKAASGRVMLLITSNVIVPEEEEVLRLIEQP